MTPDPVLFHPPVLKTIGPLAGSLAFVAVGLLMASIPGRLPVAILCIGFFGCCATVGVSRLIRRPVMLTVYPDAVEDHRARRIRFEDVDHLMLAKVSHARFLVVMTREGTVSAAEMRGRRLTGSVNEAFLPGGSRAMWIPSASVGVPLDELAERLAAMIPCQIIRLT